MKKGKRDTKGRWKERVKENSTVFNIAVRTGNLRHFIFIYLGTPITHIFNKDQWQYITKKGVPGVVQNICKTFPKEKMYRGHGIYIRWYLINRCALKEQSLLFDLYKAFD